MSIHVRAVAQLVQRAEAFALPTLYSVQSEIDRRTAVAQATAKVAPAVPDPKLAELGAEIKSRQEESEVLGKKSLDISQETCRLISEKWRRERSFWSLWSQRIDYDAEIKRSNSERASIEAKRSEAQRSLREVVAVEETLRREYRESCTAASAEYARTSKLSKLRLAVYDRARKLLSEWPALAYCGVRYVLAMASRIEKMREKGWDPEPQEVDFRIS